MQECHSHKRFWKNLPPCGVWLSGWLVAIDCKKKLCWMKRTQLNALSGLKSYGGRKRSCFWSFHQMVIRGTAVLGDSGLAAFFSRGGRRLWVAPAGTMALWIAEMIHHTDRHTGLVLVHCAMNYHSQCFIRQRWLIVAWSLKEAGCCTKDSLTLRSKGCFVVHHACLHRWCNGSTLNN